MTVRIINADVRDGLAQLEDESVHMVLCSPPYWGLRCYGVDGQIGLEPTLGEHIDVLVEVFREVRRVLRRDGTFWLNYGDCYATSPNGRSAADTKALGNDDRTFRDKPVSTIGPIYRGKRMQRGGGRWGGGNNSDPSLKAKDLCLIPHRLAIALQEDGWWVRSDIIWAKPNPMPESIKDRPSSAHEHVFLLSKADRYFFDREAAKEQASENSHGALNGGCGAKARQTGDHRGPLGLLSADGTRNMRNVWTIATQAFPAAHFATFPPELAERCIKAGCPQDGTVLDTFGGAGTTGLVADRLSRDAILIELNAEYCEMARRRIEGDAPMFVDVQQEALP